MKKGFTLIELLAVIVVLAVVSLIAIPQTSRVIKRANLNAAMLGAESYANAVELYSITSELKGLGSVKDGIYEIGSLNINVKGKAPKSGVFTVKAGKVVDAKLCVNDYSVDVKNNHAKISDNDYCTGSKYTVRVYSDSKAINTSTDQKKFTIDKENKVAIVCNNGATPIVNGDTLYVMPAKENATCFITNTLYDAVSYSDKTKSTIEVINDSVESTYWAINDYKDITLNLNGHKFQYNAESLKNVGYVNGKLTINGDKDSLIESSDNLFNISATGTLVINDGNYKSLSDVEKPVSTLFIANSGDLTINDGNFEAINMTIVYSSGHSVINDGKFYSDRLSSVISAKNDLIINGGEFISNSQNSTTVAASTSGNVTINNANVKAIGSTNKALVAYGKDAKMTVNNAKVHAVSNAIASQDGTLVINNVYSESETNNALYTSGSDKTSTIVHGGVFISNKSYAITLSGAGSFVLDQKNKPVYISMKSLNSDKAAFGNSSTGKIIIKGSKADKCTSNYKDTKTGLCIYSEGNREFKTAYGGKAIASYTKSVINIDGGTYYGGYIAIHNSNTGILNIKNAEILSENTAIYNWDGSIYVCASTAKSGITFNGGPDSTTSYNNLNAIGFDAPRSYSQGTINASYAGSCNEELAS